MLKITEKRSDAVRKIINFVKSPKIALTDDVSRSNSGLARAG